jgi:hypothetical protein
VKRFPGEIDFWGKKIGYSYLIIGIVVSVAISALSGDLGWVALLGGWCFFLMSILLMMDIPFLNYYVLAENRIVCVRMGIPSFIGFDRVADIRKIDWKDIKKFSDDEWIKMTVVRHNEKRYGRSYASEHLDEIIPSLKSILRHNNLVSRCTAAPSTLVRGGKAEVLVKKAEYILITMTDGKQYAISPKNPDEFLTLAKMALDEKKVGAGFM